MPCSIDIPAVFIVGAPRSGTTYLQNILGEHPAIAAPQETELFSHYVVPMRRMWDHHLPDDPELWRRHRYNGLPAVLTTEQFDELVAGVVRQVYEAALALKPGATVVLDKVPDYAPHAGLIHRFLPHATFVHVIRDGRDVAASLISASRGWGSDWAPSGADQAARKWAEYVRGARDVRALTDRYVEVRYETLTAPETGPGIVHDVLARAGVSATREQAAEMHRIHSERGEGPRPSSILYGGEVARRLSGRPEEPAGFFGAGGSGGWRAKLTPYQQWAFDLVAGDLLVELGYEPSRDWLAAAPKAPRQRLAFERGAQRAGLLARKAIRTAAGG